MRFFSDKNANEILSFEYYDAVSNYKKSLTMTEIDMIDKKNSNSNLVGFMKVHPMDKNNNCESFNKQTTMFES